MKNIKIRNTFSQSIRLALILTLFLILSGCVSSTFNLIVQPDKLSNDGQPFYVIIKQEQMSNYLHSNVGIVYDSYLKKDKKNNSTLIYPNKGKQSISIKKSEKEGISVYFLFKKKPSEGHWKFYINPDNEKDKRVNISKNNVMEVS
ncbi:hypothetical protein fh0823_15340 [Francisella halioticida]|uniref:Type VI lipoprotein IgE-like C-terminal domain-containing protein n=1 Tax=Francisella halioticida TaxID=549298 RepID=A0ABM6M0Y3_9GAMM|nr:type VI secretion system lipoprotein IglE [Francisella halioticida]ASG68505.1 hypothetical protein CDV26_08975 [Francisella halioticida]BCD91395.1 hypothetical protein fh0823_15340 [Francisella halioticida]